jgi:hypothetical protein
MQWAGHTSRRPEPQYELLIRVKHLKVSYLSEFVHIQSRPERICKGTNRYLEYQWQLWDKAETVQSHTRTGSEFATRNDLASSELHFGHLNRDSGDMQSYPETKTETQSHTRPPESHKSHTRVMAVNGTLSKNYPNHIQIAIQIIQITSLIRNYTRSTNSETIQLYIY